MEKNFRIHNLRTAKEIIFLVFLLCAFGAFFCFQIARAETSSISIDNEYDENVNVHTFEGGQAAVSLKIDGKVKLEEDDSMVRVIAKDADGKDYLVYETYTLIADDDNFDISDECDETCALDGVTLDSIRVEVTDAKIQIDKLVLDDGVAAAPDGKMKAMGVNKNSKEEKEQQKIDKINAKIEEKGMHWMAGETPVSQLSYEEKKALFKDGVVPNLYGFEYYKGGIFEIPRIDGPDQEVDLPTSGDGGDLIRALSGNDLPGADPPTESTGIVDGFDWRDRHGQNWLTPIKNQLGCGSCWAFAATGAVENDVNTYFNQRINLDLSEQDVLSCSGAGNCQDGGDPGASLEYAENTGIVDESCFPYTATNNTCSNKCANSTELIKITGYQFISTFNGITTEDTLKRAIIEDGPISSGIWTWPHAMVLAGFGKIKQGDVLFEVPEPNDEYYYEEANVPPGDPYIGTTYWIFKNSWGTSWGESGYGRVKVDLDLISYTYRLDGPIISSKVAREVACTDNDEDGYCNWGTGSKPSSCDPLNCNAEEDCDDSDPDLFRFDHDNNYNCIGTEFFAGKDITAFSFAGLNPAVSGTIDEDNHTVSVDVPLGTNLTNLVPTIAISGASISPASGVAQNFSNPVVYTVTARDNSTQTYTVTVTPEEGYITSFYLADYEIPIQGTINELNRTIAIKVPYGTSLTSLRPSIVVKNGATISPASGVAQNFSSPVVYTLTAPDNSTKNYTVSISRENWFMREASIKADGTNSNDASDSASVSSDGRFVAFQSSANNLIDGDTNGVQDIFVKDTISGSIVRASVSNSGEQGDGISSNPSISADGRYVAFHSESSNLVYDNTYNYHIYVRDLKLGSTSFVDPYIAATPRLKISANGRYVAYVDTFNNVSVRDLQSDEIARASEDVNGVEGNGDSDNPFISSDGRYVVFGSNSSNLVSGDNNGKWDVFLKDMTTGAITRISISSAGAEANDNSGYLYGSSVSDDGRYVTFFSAATNLISGGNNQYDNFLRDTQLGTTVRLAKNSLGEDANSGIERAVVSPDGEYVTFGSFSTNLIPDDNNVNRDVFIKNISTGEVNLVSQSVLGNSSNADNYNSSFSPDGNYVVFSSAATNLTPGDSADSNGKHDIFVRNLAKSVLGAESLHHVNISPNTTQTITAGEEVLFIAQGQDENNNDIPDLEYSWTGTEDSFEQYGLFSSIIAGTYHVKVSSGGIESNEITVTVNPASLHHINISPSSTQTITTGQTVQFSAQGQDQYNNNISGLTYVWTGTNSSGLFNNVTVGTYHVKASNGGMDSPEVTVVVARAQDTTPPATPTGLGVN